MALAMLAAVLSVTILGGRDGVRRYVELRRDLDRRGREAYQRIARNRAAAERLHGLRIDNRVVEETARSTLGVVDKNEIVIVFREPRATHRH